ncbi:MAG TPA: DUF4214 domain-containing protein, partial [Pirellulales bacterium]|nr:DUF4214 domain-containing protein [Pirellulales bacterium]
NLTLPGLTSYKSNQSAFIVDGANSVLDVSALTTLTQQAYWAIKAANGGTIKLSGLSGTLAPIDGVDITDTGNSMILDGNLASLNGVNITVDGTDSGLTAAWATFTGGQLTTKGGSTSFPALTDAVIAGLSFNNGGTFNFPVLTKGSLPLQNGQSVTIQSTLVNLPADGASGAVINMPASQSLTIAFDNSGTFSGGTTFNVGAGSGIVLAGGSYLGGATFNLGNGSSVNLTGAQTTTYGGTLTSTGGGTVTLGSATENGTFSDATGGAMLDFSGNVFQWRTGSVDSANGDLTNQGTINLAGNSTEQFNGGGTLDNAGTLTVGGTLNVGGNFTQTSGGTLNEQMAGSAQSGQFGQVIATGAATLAGNFNLSLVGGFSPAAGQNYAVLKYASATGSFATVTGLVSGMTTNQTATEFVLVTPLSVLPSSSVTSLPATETSTSFTVSWSGSDTGGPGIAGYSVFVSDNGGAFTAFKTNITATSATFTGQAGHTYGFYSVATDTAGNVQTTPTTAQATTTVALVTALPTSTVSALPALSPATFTVSWSGMDAGGPGIATYSVYVSDNGGPFTAFQTATTATSASFTGVAGHTYSFYSVATDTAGGVQTTPTAAQASTQVATDPKERYVAAVYHDVLDRLPDPKGLQYWMQLLDNGTAVSAVAEAIAHSDEYYAVFVIEPDYLTLLGRAADQSGVTYWTQQMHNGLTDQELEAGFVASSEFYQSAGGTNLAWIDAVYKLLLGRSADSDGEKYWNSQLAGGATLHDVALRIANSAENDTQLINDDYMHYLGRPADPQGLAFWLIQFGDGATNEDVIAGFTGSAEYYDEHS